MAKKRSSSSFSLIIKISPISLFLLSLLLLPHHLSASSHFEGFDAEENDDFAIGDAYSDDVVPMHRSSPPPISLSTPTPDQSNAQSPPSDESPNAAQFDHWDENEFEGIPDQNLIPSPNINKVIHESTESSSEKNQSDDEASKNLGTYTVEIVCVSFLIMFAVNYIAGKRENEKLALAWAKKFATKDSIFDKNFSLLGVGETDDSPLLLQENKTVFKFWASGRRYCSGMMATIELKSRHDLISKLYNMVVPCKNEITFEVYMNDEAMDHIVFALARKKLAKMMLKEAGDLQRFAGLVAVPNGRKWVAEELQVVSESKEVAGDLVNGVVLDQVFGNDAFEKVGKGFISMHFSDQRVGSPRKMLMFKFALPDAKHMGDMTQLVALVPYYIDLIGRYKLSSQARPKTEAARTKLAQEIYKELQNARQEALQIKKAEQRKKSEEAEAKLSAEALRKREAKERARQMKKAMPKMKMTRGS